MDGELMAKRDLLVKRTKLDRTCRRMNLPTYAVVGLLECLWHLVAEECIRGDIGRFTNEDIAVRLDYQGDEDELIEKLVSCGWLDLNPEHRLVVHDWPVHCPDFVHMKLSRRGESFADGTTPSSTKLSFRDRLALEQRAKGEGNGQSTGLDGENGERTDDDSVRTLSDSVRTASAQNGEMCALTRDACPIPIPIPITESNNPEEITRGASGVSTSSLSGAGSPAPRRAKPKRGTGISDAEAKRQIASRMDDAGPRFPRKPPEPGGGPPPGKHLSEATVEQKAAKASAIFARDKAWREWPGKKEPESFEAAFRLSNPAEFELVYGKEAKAS